MSLTWRRVLRASAVATGVAFFALLVDSTPAAARLASCQPSPVITDLPWAQQVLDPERVWPHATGRGVTVAVIDSAVDTTHPQMSGLISKEIDFLGAEPTSCVAHGTGVASIINAQRAPGVGFVGLAPEARVLPIRVSDRGPDGSGAAADIDAFAAAIRAAAQRARVINISLVMRTPDERIERAINAAIDGGVVVVAAVGNNHEGDDDDIDAPSYPAAYRGVLGVGAINPDGSRLPESQVGPYVDVVAPGGDVVVAAPVRGHLRVSGTSYAAPFVAATAALVREARPELSVSEVVNRIIATATPFRSGPGYGAGLVNPYRAVTEDSLFSNTVAALPPAPARMIDAAAAARVSRWDTLGYRSLLISGGVLVLLLAVHIGAGVYRRGRQRRWRPGRITPPAE